MPLMDWSPLSGRPTPLQTRQPRMSPRSDSSPNAIDDRPESGLLRDIKLCLQYAQEHVAPRWCLLWLHARSRKRKYRLSLRAHAIAKNIHAPAKPTRRMNPYWRDKLFEWSQRSI